MGAQGSKEDEQFLDAIDQVGPQPVTQTPGGSKVPVNKLYHRIPGTDEGGKSSAGLNGTWVLVSTDVKWKFVEGRDEDDEDDDEDEENFKDTRSKNVPDDWFLVIPGWANIKVELSLFNLDDEKRRIDMYSPGKGPLALRMPTGAEYTRFGEQFKKCIFENSFKVAYTEANIVKTLGKDFAQSWDAGEDGDEAMWDAGESFSEEKQKENEAEGSNLEDYSEKYKSQRSPLGLAMGALENSFMLHESGIDVFKNNMEHHRVQSSGATINLTPGGKHSLTPRKGLLIRGETGMLLMSPAKEESSHSSGLRQVDLEQEKVVAEWKFQKDGTPISMLDVTGDSKGAQLEDRFTFMGLDDNRLCRWDMRDRNGMVQQLTPTGGPALTWNEGHQFSRGTNFTCMVTTGDGSVAVGSRDGKVRLYSESTMRQAKTSFPGFGVRITHIDASYDGHWVLATTDKFLFLLNTMWRDDKGKEKNAFHARGGSNVAAPRMLKLLPQHVAVAGPDFKFEKASFSWVTESGKDERHIVASVKKYSVIWNLKTVRNQQHPCYQAGPGVKSCTCYTVKELDELAVDTKFMNDKFLSTTERDAPLVVAMPHLISSLQIE